MAREVEKADMYGHIVVIAAKQHLDGKRSTLPTFTPFIASDYGEIAPQAIVFQEWLVNQFRLKCRDGSKNNGHATPDLVRNFRHRFKMSVQVAIAAGGKYDPGCWAPVCGKALSLRRLDDFASFAHV